MTISQTEHSAQIPAAPERKTGRRRAYLMAGTALAIGALLTAAAFTDRANINLGSGSGIGVGDWDFALQVADVDELGAPIDGKWVSASSADGVTYAIPGASSLIPGTSGAVTVPIRNISEASDAILSVGVELHGVDASDAALVEQLRFTAVLTDSDGAEHTLLSNASLNQVTASPVLLSANSAGRITVTVDLLPTADTSVQGKTASLRAVITGIQAEQKPARA